MKRLVLLLLLCLSACLTDLYASDGWDDYFGWNLDYWPGESQSLRYAIDYSDVTLDVPDPLEVVYALNQAFLTWNNVAATEYDLAQVPDDGGIYDFVDSGDGYPWTSVNWTYWYANIYVGGWVDSATWLALGGNPSNLAAAFPVTIRENGQRVDYNGDGYWDLAQVVILFNDSYDWSVDGSSGTHDIQSVATHEIGHALGLQHSPDGVDSVMYPFLQAGQIERDLYAWEIDQLQGLYPVEAVPEPSAMLLFLFGLVPFLKKKKS